MSQTSFFVRPLEVAFFGPPDAQSAGDTHYARSLFPPPPRTFQGLVRSRLLAAAVPALDLSSRSQAAKKERAALVGEPDQLPDGWQIEGPVPVANAADGKPLVPWLPAPTLLRRVDAPEPRRARFIALHGEDDALGGVAGENGNTPKYVLGVPGFDDPGPLDGWISASNLRWALTGKGAWDRDGARDLPPMVRRELRVGVAINPQTRRAQDRMLYAVEQLRFDGKGGFLGTLRAELPAALPASALVTGTAPFGRWNRLAALDEVPEVDAAWTDLVNGGHLPARLSDSARFWLVLLTPARLKDPMRPGLEIGAVEILGALLGRPLTLGGFSLADHRARPNQRYVPAGSAWLFRVPDRTPEQRADILRRLNGAHALGDPEEKRMGFGRVLVGIESEG